jgi:hypothetical protein
MGLVKVNSNGSITSAFQVSSRLPEIRANGLATTNIALETTVKPTPKILTGTSTMIAVEEGGSFLVDAKQFKFTDARSRLIMRVLRQCKAIMLLLTYLKTTKNWSVV